MANVFVTGATGFIGTRLVKRLVSEGHKVTCLARDKSKCLEMNKLKINFVKGDVMDKESVGKALEGIKGEVDFAFHLAAVIGDHGEPEELIWKVNVEGTRNVIDECFRHGVKKFIHFSSFSVYGYRDAVFDEKTPYNAYTTVYGKSKRESEKIVGEYKRKGMKAVIIQPVFVYGPGLKAGFVDFFRMIKNGKFMFIGDGRNKIHLVHVDNLIDGVLLAAKSRKAENRKYIIGDEEPLSLRKLVYEAAELMNIKPPTKHIPKIVATPVLYFLARSKLYFMIKYQACDISKAKKELGYRPKIKTKEGLREFVRYLNKENII
jgi:nucleoside-diphosphate-sugar epimerase